MLISGLKGLKNLSGIIRCLEYCNSVSILLLERQAAQSAH